MNKANIFVSYDLDTDRDLCDLLVAHSAIGGLGFEVSGRSEAAALRDPSFADVRRRIRRADHVIVICGEHTEASVGVFAELRIAQEEQKPYFLLWGRRELMCTKPEGAKATEGMYRWTFQTLRDQIATMTRSAARDASVEGMRRTPSKRPGSDISIP